MNKSVLLTLLERLGSQIDDVRDKTNDIQKHIAEHEQRLEMEQEELKTLRELDRHVRKYVELEKVNLETGSLSPSQLEEYYAAWNSLLQAMDETKT